ncbi:hypothetical protein TRFO_02071 [Tritrichomonas foetus]|uniref:SH3 domain-containing protein n=1 Tax=Tritrichomonas foetus TaxID=1144522 RepID=A0A1J4JCV5_9EUKA|nr:hypothetical protein TRFO_02071 [Tritrichomonas foetus]|eukprot:OHS96936.1 hypothetical protein TRFO_02071 [Tritrichomonas foetus]
MIRPDKSIKIMGQKQIQKSTYQKKMTLEQLLWKIPTDLTQKYDFPELVFLASFLRSEKDIITQADAAIHALEKGYKAHANYYSQSIVKKSNYAVDSTEDAIFRRFISTHNKMCQKFNDYALHFDMLHSTKAAPLVEAYNNSFKTMYNELMKLKNMIADPIDQLLAARKSYDNHLPKLLNLTTQIARNQITPAQINQQLPKALSAVDTKLQRVQTSYLAFRAKFLEYCQAREVVFMQADILLEKSGKELKKILAEAEKIDKDMFDSKEFEQQIKERNVEPSFWNKTEPRKKKEKFFVTVVRTIEVEGHHPITPNDKYELVDACGDDWQIKDKNGQPWHVPSEFLVPLQ